MDAPSPLIGRDEDVEAITTLLGRGLPVAVAGDAGIGKTAVTRAVAAGSRQRASFGGGLATLAWSSFLPLARALRLPLPGGDRITAANFVVQRVGGGLLVLDDLHWADPDTLGLLSLLVPRIAILAAFRPGEVRSEAAQDCLVAAGFHIVPLGPLRPAAARALVKDRWPDLDAAALEQVIETARGNPLFLEELPAPGQGPSRLQITLANRVASQSLAARTALAALGLLGHGAPPGVLGRGAEELVVAGLAVVSRGLVETRHSLLSEIAVANLSPPERRALHARLGRVVPDPGEAARHHAAASEYSEAVTKALEAAQWSTRPGERARHLALAADVAQGPEADGLRLRAAGALSAVGRHESADRLAAMIETSEPGPLAEARLYRSRHQASLGDIDGAVRLVDEGLALLAGGHHTLALRLDIHRAGLLVQIDPGAAVAEAHRIVKDARRLKKHEARARGVLGAAQLAVRAPVWESTLVSAIELARVEGDVDVECAAAANLVAGRMLHGDPGEALGLAKEMVDRTQRMLLGSWSMHFEAVRLWLELHHRGNHEEVIATARDHLTRPQLLPTRQQIAALLGLALADTGQLEDAVVVLERAQADGPSGAGQLITWTQAELALLSGQLRQAVRLALLCLSSGVPRLPVTALAALTAGWASERLGQPTPEVASDQLDMAGAAAEFEALCRRRSDPASAQALFDLAASGWSGRMVRAELRCAHAAAQCAGASGNVEGALARLSELERRSLREGWVAQLAQVRLSLRSLGGRPTTEARRSSASPLSPRERQVLQLVARDLTTAEIAQRLALGPATVETQVRSAMLKLGALNRAHAAVLAEARGLFGGIASP